MIKIKSKYDYSNFDKEYICDIEVIRCCILMKANALSIATPNNIFFISDTIPPFEILRDFFKNTTTHLYVDWGKQINTCRFCGGSGKWDWARRPRGRVLVRNILPFIPQKHPKKIFSCNTGLMVGFQFLPLLEEDEVYCYDCGATGIHFKNYRTVFGEKTLWYENTILKRDL